MSEATARLLREALQLDVRERAELAAELVASLDGEPEPDVDAAWASEIERRAQRATELGSPGSTWAEVLARIAARRIT